MPIDGLPIIRPKNGPGAICSRARRRWSRSAVRSPAQGRRTAAHRDHAGADRSRPQGGQGLVLHRARAQRRATPGQGVRRKVPRHRGPHRALGARADFQRIAQEQSSRINAVDVANSTDPAHYLDWKKNDWLAPYVPDDVARHFPADQVDPDGMHATSCAWMEAIGYNTTTGLQVRGTGVAIQ